MNILEIENQIKNGYHIDHKEALLYKIKFGLYIKYLDSVLKHTEPEFKKYLETLRKKS